MDKKGGDTILEKEFQKHFIDDLKSIMPNAVVLKNDARYRQGIPDWIVIDKSGVYIFELKAHSTASKRPNQEYYINLFSDMGYYARFVCPENAEEVLNGIQQAQ